MCEERREEREGGRRGVEDRGGGLRERVRDVDRCGSEGVVEAMVALACLRSHWSKGSLLAVQVQYQSISYPLARDVGLGTFEAP